MRIIRDYEVSIWTLQDSFITVLKPFGIELKGQIQKPKLKIVDDGTLEFTFVLPMYYSINGKRLENPLWCNTINGIIVASMRKAKIIFNKHQQGETVFEFLITKVIEQHEKDQIFCEVTCEGLAFHELGKLGYKIALEGEDLTEEEFNWFSGEKVYKRDQSGMITDEVDYVIGSDQKIYPAEQPSGTLQYWNDKIFKRADGNWKWGWTYEIQMNYSNNPGLGLESNKVYEDAYVSSWEYNADHDQVEAQSYENAREKERLVDLKKSNVYNLTQNLAKEFGVFCRYEYEHDSNFHIVGRKVIYYNNFIMEKYGPLDITYPYTASKINRTNDSTDLITKLFVDIENNNEDGDIIDITCSSANKTRENYILNFDYLNTIGAITAEQYAAVKQFETDIYKLNMKIIPNDNQKIILLRELTELQSTKTQLETALGLYRERYSAADDQLSQLTNNTGILSVTESNPKMGIIQGENPSYINISESGVIYDTLRIYKTYNTTSHVLTDEYRGAPEYNEFGNLTRVINLQHYQSYIYSPTSGMHTLTGEYGHLQTLDRENKIFRFAFNSKEYKELFRRMNRYMLAGCELSFNLEFDTLPDNNNITFDIYFVHADVLSIEGLQPIKAGIPFTLHSQIKRYTPTIKIGLTENIPEFRINNADSQRGIAVIVKVNCENGSLSNSIKIDDSSISTSGLKASLRFGGRIEAVESNTSRTQSRVYLTYDYSPELAWKRVSEIWHNREIVDTRKLEEVNIKIKLLEDTIAACERESQKAIAEKELAISRFERLMGPALREGYWQPEDYMDYGQSFIEKFDISSIIAGENAQENYLDDLNDTTVRLKFLYDSQPFTAAEVNYISSFSYDNEEEYIFYPCIKLTNQGIINFVKQHYNELSVSFCDITRLDTKYFTNDAYRKIYSINSLCQYAFMNINGVPTPVIMVTGARADNLTDRQFAALTGQLYKTDDGTIVDEYSNADVKLTVISPLNTEMSASYSISKSDWFIPTSKDQMLFPSLQITSLGLRTDEQEIQIKYDDQLLKNYYDFQILSRNYSYFIVFKPSVFIQYGFGKTGEIHFIISNANTTIYLDGMQVAKENSRPKVEYEIKINNVNKDLIAEAYKYLGYIANINDTDLKFEHVQGYISELELDLDKPQEDNITIKNYKTKFEDLFSTIVAQSEQMQKNATTIAAASSAFTATGKIIPDVIEDSIRSVDLSAAFSKGTLKWDETNGIWAESDSGVVAIRGGGIFTATQREGDSWRWNTGITPEGINADLITAGQLDTNRIKVYAGDQLRFQLNADGLFAYKTMFDNPKPEYVLAQNYSSISKEIQDNHGIDYRQYVVHNGEGLFLIAKRGAPLILENRGDNGYYIRRINQDVERVAITWDGLTLRNYNNEKVFYADADTGDLTLAGTIYAKAGVFEGEVRAKSLFIGDDTINNYIDDDGHLSPAIFSDETAAGITKAASLTVDTENGKIKLSSLLFDKLGDVGDGSSIKSSGIVIEPTSLKFYTSALDQSSETQEHESTGEESYTNSMVINTEGIQLNADGLISIQSANNKSYIAFGTAETINAGDDGEITLFDSKLSIGGDDGSINCQQLEAKIVKCDSLIMSSNEGSFIQSPVLNNAKIGQIYFANKELSAVAVANLEHPSTSTLVIPQGSLWIVGGGGITNNIGNPTATTPEPLKNQSAQAPSNCYKSQAGYGALQKFVVNVPFPANVNFIKNIIVNIQYNTFNPSTSFGGLQSISAKISDIVQNSAGAILNSNKITITDSSFNGDNSTPNITVNCTSNSDYVAVSNNSYISVSGTFNARAYNSSKQYFGSKIMTVATTFYGWEQDPAGASDDNAISEVCAVHHVLKDVEIDIAELARNDSQETEP